MHVGMQLVQDSTLSATLTQGDFPKKLQPLGTSPKLLSPEQLLSPAHRLNCGLLVSSCFPRRMSNCASASSVSLVGLRLSLVQIFALGWFALPLALIRCRAAMYIALMVW